MHNPQNWYGCSCGRAIDEMHLAGCVMKSAPPPPAVSSDTIDRSICPTWDGYCCSCWEYCFKGLNVRSDICVHGAVKESYDFWEEGDPLPPYCHCCGGPCMLGQDYCFTCDFIGEVAGGGTT
jgi:hypothetical protein